MDIAVRSFRLQKAGNAFEECEDSAYPKSLSGRCGEHNRHSEALVSFAIADGATEGMFSGAWADILVKVYCRNTRKDSNPKFFLNEALRAWQSWIQNHLKTREAQNRPIKWFEEPGLEAGAFSAFLGVTFADSPEPSVNRWKAFAAGDCCLFQVRDNALLSKFPVETSGEFGNRPFLINSKAVVTDKFIEACKVDEGDCLVGDVFYLMTDALACWFLKEYEANNFPWMDLSRCTADIEVFQKWVDGLRAEKNVKNDDVTLLCIEVMG